MFKLLDPKFFAVAVAWVAVFLLTLLNSAAQLFGSIGLAPRMSWVILGVQALFTLVFVTPLWRILWRRVPLLRSWYPDLNGEWDLEGQTNWSRIDATLKAANGETGPINMRLGDEATLPPLGATRMRARITQSWFRFDMTVWNPRGTGPIKESKTLSCEPFRAEDGRHGLTYVFEQENETVAPGDDSKFIGAAQVALDRDKLALCGRMWTDRSWRRGMNTAADIRLVRHGAVKLNAP